MPINISPFNTTALSNYAVSNLESKIQEYNKLDVSKNKIGKNISLVTLSPINVISELVPSFKLPYVNTKNEIYLDIRDYSKLSQNSGSYDITKRLDYAHVEGIALLMESMQKDPSVIPNRIGALLPFAGNIFTMFISNTISNMLNLGMADSTHLNILVGLHFAAMSVGDINKSNVNTWFALRVSEYLNMRNMNSSILEVYKKITLENPDGVKPTIDNLIKNIKLVINTPKTENLSTPILLQRTARAGFFDLENESLYMAVSYEHLPTWLMFIHRVIKTQSYRSMVGVIIKKKPSQGSDYNKNLELYLNELKR